MLTFDQFVATKKEIEDVSDVKGYGEEGPGLVYAGSLVIENLGKGEYQLVLDRDSWISRDLHDLERKLYEFALEEKII